MSTDDVKQLPEKKRPPFSVRALRELWRLAVDRPYRNLRWLDWVRPKGAFQPFNDTRVDRYPRIFGFVQSQLGAASKARILSFGCSTGEEVFSLRDYFPHAEIKGIDINPGNIAVCRRRLKQARDTAVIFETAASTDAEAAAFYDAIFCMAVLRHGSLGNPGVTRCDHLIRFEDFAKAVADFERCLKPGGLLVMRNSNFRLCDAAAATAFETLLSVPFGARARRTPIFGPDNRLMEGVEYPDTVFRKIEK
ncbi:MAG: class I SAM-dependent methyltransferase [Xanthobacteraceae bacterium]